MTDLHNDPASYPGAGTVFEVELRKLWSQARVRAVFGLCLVVPFLVAGAFKLQGATPQDTLFGQWVHTSGFALPLVILSFASQWAFPVLVALVSGDVFSSEDRFGTWKSVLTRSCTRGELFAGKLGAALTYTLTIAACLAASSIAAGALIGTQPIIGLTGQTVPAGHAGLLVLESWATQIPPLLAFCALAVLLSVVSRTSLVGVGGPVLIGLLLQLTVLLNLPESLRVVLLNTAFDAWHGLWAQPAFYGPVRQGLVTSLLWAVNGAALAWVIFRRRSIDVK